VITSTFSGHERRAAIGTWTAWTGVSTVIGPLLGGWLIGISSWRVIFLLNVPIAVLTIAIALRLMPRHEKRRARVTVDFAGALLCVAGIGGLVFGFIEQPSRGRGNPTIVGTIAGGAACLVAFVIWEMHAPVPMLPLRLFRMRNFSIANVETFAVYGGLSPGRSS
jgi:MFS family permease